MSALYSVGIWRRFYLAIDRLLKTVFAVVLKNCFACAEPIGDLRDNNISGKIGLIRIALNSPRGVLPHERIRIDNQRNRR